MINQIEFVDYDLFNPFEMMPPFPLTFTIGPSHSGKSTFCNYWATHYQITGVAAPRPRVIACSDSIRKGLCGRRYNSNIEPMVFGMKQIFIKALLDRGHDVIVDGTHTTKASIQRILEIDPNAIALVFNTPLEVCLDRIKLTGQTDMESVIRRHHRQLQTLLDEGLDKIFSDLKEKIAQRWNKGI